jgi:XrtJ-associated TM-motif-TM protein
VKVIGYISFVFVVLLFATVSAHAQTGCTDSPECPTAVLGLVGSVGAFSAPWLKKLFRRSHNRE